MIPADDDTRDDGQGDCVGAAQGTEGWTLLRAAVIAVGAPPLADIGFAIEEGDADFHTLRPTSRDGAPFGMLGLARVPLTGPPSIAEELLHVPDAERRRAERLIEMSARFLALEYRAVHRVMSPSPCLGFLGPESELQKYVDKTVVTNGSDLQWEHVWPARLLDGEGQADRLHLLKDRLDGVEMLTEALNSASPLGRFTQLWRFFERAFHCGHTAAGGNMQDFLPGHGPHNFEQAEIEAWTAARGPAVHADRPVQPKLDSDVQPFLIQMTEAAYDVLLNKNEWFSKSTTRRNAWAPKDH